MQSSYGSTGRAARGGLAWQTSRSRRSNVCDAILGRWEIFTSE